MTLSVQTARATLVRKLPLDAMAQLWIVHRDARWRAALRRMVGPVDVIVGDPSELGGFRDAAPPRAVVLGLAGDFELELEWAHRHASHLANAVLVLLARERDRAEAERLFDALATAVVPLSDDATTLRRRLAAALAYRPVASLTARTQRDEIARRFELWTRDLEIPALLAAADPARARLPLLVRGEPGTGRGLVARYFHQAVALDARAAFLALRGAPGVDPFDALAREASLLPVGCTLSVCIEDADRLDFATQRALRDWIEYAPPVGTLRADRIRWMATAGPGGEDDVDLKDTLVDALGGHAIVLPPLRERPAAIDALIAATGRRFSPEALAHLRAHPWPGNLRELDAVLRRTIAARSADPIDADDLRFDVGILEAADSGRSPGGASAPRGADRPNEPRAESDARPAAPASESDGGASVQGLAAAVAHEVGNPLVGIRTYASMLPSRFDDPEFRSQFSERVAEDTRRIEAVIETLAQLGGLAEPARLPVDVSELVARVLEQERPRIRERRLVVLEELDRRRPLALGDAAQLGFAFERLLGTALDWVPARGDFYVATRHRAAAGDRRAALLVELRMRGTDGGLGFGEQSLAVAAARAVVAAHGGSLVAETGPGGETSIRIELPALESQEG